MGRDEAGSARNLRIPVRFTRKRELTRPERPGNVTRVASKEIERSTRKRVRSLRTQQRTDSQCQFFELVLCWAFHRSVVGVWLDFDRVSLARLESRMFLWFVDHALRLVGCGAGYMHSMESLILAQDERWRRA